MIEVSLVSSRHFKSSSIQANHIITVPLVAMMNINEGELENKKETSTSWPQREEDANTCVLSAYIPHKGCLRGTNVNIHIDFRQPERYIPVESVLIELFAMEFIASAKDSLPDITRQLDDKVIEAETKKVDLFPTHGQSVAFNQHLLLPISRNITPTIDSVSAKVMKIDYKLRVTVGLPGKDKKLTVNLPLFIGTTGNLGKAPLTQDMYRGYPTSKLHQIEPLEYPTFRTPTNYYPQTDYPPLNMDFFSGTPKLLSQSSITNIYPPNPVESIYLESTSNCANYMYPYNGPSESSNHMYLPHDYNPSSPDSNRQSYPPPFYALSTRNSVPYISPLLSQQASISDLSEAIDNIAYRLNKKKFGTTGQ